jgi:hypothetical protein
MKLKLEDRNETHILFLAKNRFGRILTLMPNYNISFSEKKRIRYVM